MLVGFLLALSNLQAAESNSDVMPSTTPLGSPYYRHLAYDFDLDLRELVKFEKKGFGRSEIVVLVLISEETGKPIKEYGNRRIKEKVPLKKLAEEAGLDYRTLIRVAREIKSDIEQKGNQDLPPPVYPKPKETEKKENKSDKSKERSHDELEIQKH